MSQPVDYIIVGQGIAGSCLALKLIKERKTFLVIDEAKNQSSSVAAGIYNPVVLKRFVLVWNAYNQLKKMHEVFTDVETLTQQKYIYNLPTYRIFHNQDEVNTWYKKAQKEELLPYLKKNIQSLNYPLIKEPFGVGEVLQTGKIEIKNCLEDFKKELIKQNRYINQLFDYNKLIINENQVKYKNITAKQIVFCEGFGVKNNPFFKSLPIIGVKGEVLKIKTNNPLPKAIVKANTFLMPITTNTYFVGSTYDRDFTTIQPTQQGKNELIKGLQHFYTGTFELLEHLAAVRPTVVDRRPILGSHSQYKNVYILNGMGTRGLMLAPTMVDELYNFIEHQQPLDDEVQVSRFSNV